MDNWLGANAVEGRVSALKKEWQDTTPILRKFGYSFRHSDPVMSEG